MRILKSQRFSNQELIEYACDLSHKTGPVEDRLLHWEFGPVMEMRYSAEAKNYLFSAERVPLHWDGAFFREPRSILFLCTESEGEGGETIFVDTEKVWEALSKEEQDQCRKVRLTYRTMKVAHYGGEITLPLVQAHPVTGKTILRLAERVATALNPVELTINGVENPEGFYQWLIGKFYEPDHLFEHAWEKGDLLVVDNFTYLHGRRELGNNKKRSFKRIQIL